MLELRYQEKPLKVKYSVRRGNKKFTITLVKKQMLPQIITILKSPTATRSNLQVQIFPWSGSALL